MRACSCPIWTDVSSVLWAGSLPPVDHVVVEARCGHCRPGDHHLTAGPSHGLKELGRRGAMRGRRAAAAGKPEWLEEERCECEREQAVLAFTDVAVYGTRRTSGHGASPCRLRSAS